MPVPLHFERLIMPAAGVQGKQNSCAARRSLLAKRTNRKDERAQDAACIEQRKYKEP